MQTTHRRLFFSWICTACVAVAGHAAEADHGFIRKTYLGDNGKTFKYVVFVPAHLEPQQKLPVILFLNGWGENGDDGLRQISNNFGSDVWRMRDYFPFLAVCPQCSYVGVWTPGSENAAMAMAVLDAAIEEYGGDSKRVCVTGASVGGAGALALASQYPSRFASVVPVAVGSAGDLKNLAGVGMPIWCFYNSEDEYKLADSARTMRRELLQAGLSPFVTEFNAIGHNAWDSAYGPPALYRWILEHDLDNRNARPFRLIPPVEALREWRPRGSATWVANNDEVTASLAGNSGEAFLTSPPLGSAGEFHFDVFLQKEA
ncbi:MAG TPA: alpha/beta hydrolase-fold protein, partial [Lacipirellulaceae bacterium]|nr:alpha/beta hydrolase-fold protein [Lacipirellulaceae bacterium]